MKKTLKTVLYVGVSIGLRTMVLLRIHHGGFQILEIELQQ